MKSNIPEMIKAANTILNHIDGILLHIKTNITNGKIEGMNSKLRGFIKRTFGFKRSKEFKNNYLYSFKYVSDMKIIFIYFFKKRRKKVQI